MDKLIELLNEFDKKTFWKITLDNRIQIYGKWKCSESYLISKEYWFIQWLMENNKIDIEELADKKYKIYDYEFAEDYSDRNYETLLMLLSIQDNPIEYLISVLR